MIKVVFPLPKLITLVEFGGDFQAFFDAVYEIFREDFVEVKPIFQGKNLGLKAHPKVDGREYTFYHMTHEGSDEANRQPDLQRMERMRWPRPMIEHSDHEGLKVWCNERKGEKRILIYHEEEGYVVVLAERGNYILPWTAYLVQQDHRRRKLLKEYEAWKKAEAAQ